VLIIGVGLIGGSLAKALKEKNLAYKVVGCSRSTETVREALKLGLIDSGSTEPTDFTKESDLIIFASPLGTYAKIAERISDFLMPNAILTDIGSVKEIVIENTFPHLSAQQKSLFVPGHPIAGTEASGPGAADSNLFQDKTVILTPVEQTNKAACNKIEEMWVDIGADISYMPPEKHDEIYANVSHGIQFLAYTYRLAFPGQSKNKDENFKKFFRIAKSPTEIWLDIFKANKNNIHKFLLKFKNIFIHSLDGTDAEIALPQLIARAADEAARGFRSHAGSGFKDFTSAARNNIACEHKITETPNFIAMLDTLTAALANDSLENYLPNHD
jgi:prephenate dehydrogenase